MVGFPKTVAEKYCSLLRFQGFSFQTLRSVEGELVLLDEYEADTPLDYDVSQLRFMSPKEPSKEKTKAVSETKDFKHFLRELALLIQCYL